MISTFLCSQIVAAISLLLDILSFQLKPKKQVLICLAISTFLLAIHFLLLNDLSAALLSIIATLRLSTALYSKNLRYMYFFIILAIITGFATFTKLYSLLAISGSIIGTMATFQKSNKRMRALFMLGTLLWLVHNIFAFTPIGILIEIIMLGSNLIGFYRFFGKNVTKRT